MLTGTRWIEKLMPPVVTGAVVMIIGLNLAPVTIKSVAGQPFEMWMALITVLSMGMIAVFTKGLLQRLLLLVGLLIAYTIYAISSNVLGYGKQIDFSQIAAASWFGIPQFSHPIFDLKAMLIIAPVALILVAENLGHIKAVSAMTGENLTPQLGKAFVADGLATTLSWCRRTGHDHLWRKYRRDGRHSCLLHYRVCDRRCFCHFLGTFTKVWRSD